MTEIIKTSFCLGCNTPLDRATGAVDDEAKPKPGSLSVCAYCGCMAQFDQDMNLAVLTREQIERLEKESPDAFNIMNKVVQIVKQRNLNN